MANNETGFELLRRLVAPNVRRPTVGELLARLDEGAGEPCLFLPHIGEFGHRVMTHMRLVHFHRASRKVVCCRPGEQVLFPSADHFVTDWTDPIADAVRCGSGISPPQMWPGLLARFPGHHPIAGGGLSRVQELHAIEPGKPIPLRPRRRGLRADVVLGVRRRAFCPEKNWPERRWRALAGQLATAGLSFAIIGDRTTSFPLGGQVCHSGELDTDAAVELLQNCRLFIGTDTGSAHLASTAGARMLIFREPFFGHDFIARMEQVNPGRVHRCDGAWEQPGKIAAAALRLLSN